MHEMKHKKFVLLDLVDMTDARCKEKRTVETVATRCHSLGTGTWGGSPDKALRAANSVVDCPIFRVTTKARRSVHVQ